MDYKMAWLLNFLPEWAPQLFIMFGIAGIAVSFVLGYIPLINNYKLPIQVVSVIALVVGVWMEGAFSGSQRWKEKVVELETKILINEEAAKIELAEERSKMSNKTIEYRYVDKVRVVRDTKVVVQEKINNVVSIVDAECKVPREAIDILNFAASHRQ